MSTTSVKICQFGHFFLDVSQFSIFCPLHYYPLYVPHASIHTATQQLCLHVPTITSHRFTDCQPSVVTSLTWETWPEFCLVAQSAASGVTAFTAVYNDKDAHRSHSEVSVLCSSSLPSRSVVVIFSLFPCLVKTRSEGLSEI